MASAAIVNGRRVPIEGMMPAATHHRAEDDVGRYAKQRRSILRDHRVLVEELANAAVGQPDARRTSVLQPRPTLIHPAEKQRRGREAASSSRAWVRISIAFIA